MNCLAFVLTFGLSVLWDSGDLLESAVLVAVVYGIFGVIELLVKAWIKHKRREAKEA